jgi:hypothetical protein
MIERKIVASISDAVVLREIRRFVSCLNDEANQTENRMHPPN